MPTYAEGAELDDRTCARQDCTEPIADDELVIVDGPSRRAWHFWRGCWAKANKAT